MDEDTIKSKVIATIAAMTGMGATDINPESRIRDDLQCDSLDEVELIMIFEDEFDLMVSDEEAEKIKTVADIVALVKERLA